MKSSYPSTQTRIQVFETIRNIPYRFGSNYLDTTCKSKAKLLGELLTRTGLKVRLARSQYQLNQLIRQRLFSEGRILKEITHGEPA